MQDLIIVGAAIIIPAAILIVLRVPVFVVFFALLIGNLLATNAGQNVYEFVSSVLKISDPRHIQIALLFLPVILTVLFLRGRIHKATSKQFMELIPALFVSVTALLLLYPFLDPLKTTLENATKNQLEDYKTIIIIAAALSGLMNAWASYPKHDKDGKKHK